MNELDILYEGDIDFNEILRNNQTKQMSLNKIPSSIKVSVLTRNKLKELKQNKNITYEKVVLDLIEQNKYYKSLEVKQWKT